MKENLPVLLLKKLSLLPHQEVRLELNNELSKRIIDLSIEEFGKKILVILPINSLEESPSVKDLPAVGILTTIITKIELPNGNYRVVVKGLHRVKVINYSNYKLDKSILISNIKRLYIDSGESTEESALKRKLIQLTKQYIKLNPEVSNSIFNKVNDSESLDNLTDILGNFINFPLHKKVLYMNEFSEKERARCLIEDLSVELEVIKLNNKLDRDIREAFENEQKEYLLKAKIEKLNEELGLGDSKDREVSEYYRVIDSLDVDSKTRLKLINEVKKYNYTPANNPDASVIRNYLETVLSLPFNKSSKEELKTKNIDFSLNKTHYGMRLVKERILEYAALKDLFTDIPSPIICLIGAPGVGKTTLAMSISKALKREFFKISVGGLNDSSELTGHRRTYLGAAPGKIISGIKKCGVDNPVILIDEVDKMVKDYKGDPASVLLDILDSKQNKNFVDNYVEESFDLSKVLFILTANDESLIPRALKDRLEIIYIDSYTIYDKKDIAVNYLIPNICDKYGIKKIKFLDEIILFIITNYTLESGVRELERLLDKVIRNIIINKLSLPKINEDLIIQILGNKLYSSSLLECHPGSCNILGASPLGGNILNIQTILVPGSGDLIITGNIGDTLKNSIEVLISYLKANGYLDSKVLKNDSLHINFSKDYNIDGASGSLGVSVAIMSLINNKKIEASTSFTGNLDLYGNISKVSSLKEKIITAYNNGIKTIYLPKDNLIDLKDIPEFILNELTLVFVNKFEEVYKKVFKNKN